jgi:hypothetical protein
MFFLFPQINTIIKKDFFINKNTVTEQKEFSTEQASADPS